jgi:hypothetical protein
VGAVVAAIAPKFICPLQQSFRMQVANRIRQNGRLTILLPRELDPAAAGARMPLPPVKPVPVVNPVPPAKPSPQVKPLPSQVATRAPQSAAPEERRRWHQYYYYYTQ